jgi:formate/nitrite transporter
MDIKTYSADAYSPREIARRIEDFGSDKRGLDNITLMTLSILAGVFISMGSIFFTMAVADPALGYGVSRLLGGFTFCLGLILVIICGAELFTGNNLMAIAWAEGRISSREMMRNWVLSYIGNVAGSLGMVLLMVWSDIGSMGGGLLGDSAVQIAAAKSSLSSGEAFVRGIACNALVCLAIWMATAGRSVTDKILAIVFPITAFVAIGFEHSIANWFLLPHGFVLDHQGAVRFSGLCLNLAAVTAGNILGGSGLVAGLYWIAYLRKGRKQ